jgi:hypothetical protein
MSSKMSSKVSSEGRSLSEMDFPDRHERGAGD